MLLWGNGPIDAIFYDSGRGPKLLSILAALASTYGKDGVVGWLIRYDTWLVVAGVGFAFLWAWKRRLHWLESAVLGYLVMLTLYKTGHQQFYLPWLFMVAALLLVDRPPADRMALVLLPAVLLLSLYQYGYDIASDYYGQVLGWVRSYGGFIAFPVSASSIAACVIVLGRRNAVPAAGPEH